MNPRARQFKIGLFVLASVAILATGLFAFGLRRELEPKRTFETYVPGNAGGLTVGAAVKLKGVNVGEVTRIGFSWIEYPGGRPPCVVIHFEAKESINPSPGSTAALDEQVRQGLRAIVTNQGITGASFLALDFVDPARNPPLPYDWKPRSYVVPSAESQLDHIVAAVERTLAKLERLDLDRYAARASRDLGEASASTRAAADEVRGLAKEARGTLRGMQLEAVSEDAGHLMRGLEDSNAKLELLLDRLAGVDIRDLNDTLAGTRQAARHLDDAIEELRKYPSGFLFGKEPPPARSVDKEAR